MASALKRYNSDSAITHLYKRFNVLWFHGQLPDDTIVRWRSRLGAMGMYTDGKPPTVKLDRSILGLPRVIEWVMLHECAHAAIALRERKHHGPKWLALMKDLVRRGAFDGLF